MNLKLKKFVSCLCLVTLIATSVPLGYTYQAKAAETSDNIVSQPNDSNVNSSTTTPETLTSQPDASNLNAQIATPDTISFQPPMPSKDDVVIDYPAVNNMSPLSSNQQTASAGGVFMRHVIHMPKVIDKPVPFTPATNEALNGDISQNSTSSGLASSIAPVAQSQSAEATPDTITSQPNISNSNSEIATPDTITIQPNTIKNDNLTSANVSLLEETSDETDLNLVSDDVTDNQNQNESVSPGSVNNAVSKGGLTSQADNSAAGSYPIHNKAGKFSVGFSRQAGNNLIRFSFNNANLTLSPLTPASVTGKVDKNTIAYDEIYPSTDLHYTVEPNGLKEEVMVNKYTGQKDFYFTMGLENAVYKETSDSILFCNPSSDQTLFCVPKSYAVDSSGNRCDSVSMEITKEGLIQVSVDPDWLKKAVYPIVIDPTIRIFDATFTRSSEACKQDGTQVASGIPRYEAAKFNQGIMIEEGTTNLLSANESNLGTDSTGWICPTGRYIRDTTVLWNGTPSGKLTATANGQVPYVETYNPQFIPITAGQNYSFSAYLRSDAALGRCIEIEIAWFKNDRNTVAGWSYAVQNLAVQNQWFRISGTGTAPSDAAYGLVELVVYNALNGENLWFSGVQLEQKAFSTSWTLGGTTRAAETLTIPTANVFTKGNWTVEMVWTPTSAIHPTLNQWLWHISIDANNYYEIYTQASTGQLTLAVVSNGTWRSILSPISTSVPGNRYNIMASGDGTTMQFYVNGQGNSTSYNEPVGTLPTNMYLGSASTGAYQASGIYDDLRFSNQARTAAEALAAYQSNQPLPVDASTTCKLNFDGNPGGYTSVQSEPGIETYWNYTNTNLSGGWKASVNTWNLNLILNKSLFLIPGRGIPIGESITYNSTSANPWTFANQTSVTENSYGSVIYNKGDGGSYIFVSNGSGGYTAPLGVYLTLQKNGTGNFTILDKYRNSYNFVNGKPYQFTDRNNNVTTFTYDGNGRLYQVSDPSGRHLTYAYDASGHVISITDPANHAYQFTYQNNCLTAVTDPANQTFTLAYDANNHLTTFTDPLNRITTFYCNSNGQLQSVRDARTTGLDVYETTFTQTLQGSNVVTVVTDPGSKTATYYNDDNTGNLTEYQDALGNAWQYTWSSNNLTQAQDAKGQTSYQYDSKGNITSKTTTVDSNTSNNIVETMTYDDYSQLLSVVDGSGRTTSYKYSNQGNLISTSNPNIKESNGKKYDQYGNVIEYNPSVLGTHSLVKNGSMELPGTGGNLLANWTRSPGLAEASLEGFNSHGNSALKLSSSISTNDLFYQSISGISVNDKLTLKADLKLDNVYGNGGAIIELNYGGYYEYWSCTGTGNVPIMLTSQAASSSVTVYIGFLAGYGTAWFDGVHLEDAGNTELGYISTGFNSVENSGFENGFDNWSYPGWPTGVAAWEGYSSLEMQGAGNTYQDVPVYGGEPLTLYGMIKTTGVSGNGAYLKIDYYDASNNLITGAAVQTGSITGTQDFTQLSSIATAPSNAKRARVQCILDGTGTVFFDAIKLTPRTSDKYTYDTSGNYMLTSQDALGKQNSFSYDQNTGNELSSTDALNQSTYFSNDNLNRLQQVTDPSSHNAYYQYDSVSNLIYERDPRSASSNDNTYSTYYGPNNINQLSTLTDPLSQSATYTYDRSGNLTEISLPNGLQEDYTYDNANRLIQTSLDGGQYFTYSYDGANDLIGVSDQDNNSYSWNYDGAHRLTNSTDTFGFGLNYQWDKSNNQTVLSGSDYGTCQYNYRSDNKLSSITLPDGSNIYYDYDENGRLFQIRYPYFRHKNLYYAPNGWCISLEDNSFPEKRDSYSYYDNGNIYSSASWAGWDSFVYDANGRLTGWYFTPRSGGGNVQESYSYDAAGNILNKGSRTFTYNSANEITNSGYTYDNNGNLTGDGTFTYAYNALDQMVQIRRASDNSLVATYTYNHDGLRRSKTVYTGQTQVTTNYDWDADGNMVRESTPSGNNYYYYNPAGNLVGFKKNNLTYITHGNMRGDIVLITDTTGNIVDQYNFDPWGNQTQYTGYVTQPFRYAGYYFDDETGLYYLKSRYYSPTLGRFLTKDSLAFVSHADPGTLNLYSYAGNDPVNGVDPSGCVVTNLVDLVKAAGGTYSYDKKTNTTTVCVNRITGVYNCSTAVLKNGHIQVDSNSFAKTYKTGSASSGGGTLKQILATTNTYSNYVSAGASTVAVGSACCGLLPVTVGAGIVSEGATAVNLVTNIAQGALGYESPQHMWVNIGLDVASLATGGIAGNMATDARLLYGLSSRIFTYAGAMQPTN